MSVQLQMQLPESAAPGLPSLLAPLRAEFEKRGAEARANLEALDENLRCSMGFDDASAALDSYGAACEVMNRVRTEVRDAISGRDGWDTWKNEDRDAAIKGLTRVGHAFYLLAEAERELVRAESAEIASLRSL